MLVLHVGHAKAVLNCLFGRLPVNLYPSDAHENGGDARVCRKAGVDCGSCRVRTVSICNALKPAERAELESIARRASFGAKATIFLEGDPADSYYNITSGAVRLYRVFRNGRRQVLGFMLPGDFLGLDLGERRELCAEAVEPTTACRFGRRHFGDLLADKPHLLHKLHQRTGREINLAYDHMTALGQRSARGRVAWFLLSLHDRRGERDLDKAVVDLPMPRQDIADFLGLTIETVSRTLTLLARERVIGILPRSVRLIDKSRLAALAAD
jgi:CRP/FNR family transcriptional regulator